MRILLVEDDCIFAESLVAVLRHHYAIDQVADQPEAIYAAQVNDYDLFIIDLGLPNGSGLDVCQKLRELGIQKPILILTAEQDPNQKATCLNAGADDFICKPPFLRELEARIQALLRRPAIPLDRHLSVGELKLDQVTRQVTYADRAIRLRPKEYALLEYFMRNPGEYISREKLSEHVWNEQFDPFSNTVEVHINALRKQLGPLGRKLISTSKGKGYILINP